MPESQSPKAQSPANPPSSHRTPVLVSIIATILLASIGLTIYQLKRQKPSPASGTSPTPVVGQPSSQPVSLVPINAVSQTDSTVDWFVLDRPNNSNYSIKYPPSWYMWPTESGATLVISNFDPQTIPDWGKRSSAYRPTDSEVIVVFEVGVNPNLVSENQRVLSQVEKAAGGVPLTVRETQTTNGDLSGITHLTAFVPGEKSEFFGIDMYPVNPNTRKIFEQILSTFKLTVSNPEKLLIDSWLEQNNLNQYGDSKDTMYAGGTPLFDERTGERTDRYEYIVKKFPDRPWND